MPFTRAVKLGIKSDDGTALTAFHRCNRAHFTLHTTHWLYFSVEINNSQICVIPNLLSFMQHKEIYKLFMHLKAVL